MTIIIFLIVLAVLIFVHELGHFLAARIFGIRVDAFKIGFGPKLFAWKRGETEYGVNAIPFGGYVKIFGEDPNDENTNGPDAARSFVHKPKWQQIIALAAGVLFNFIFAWLLYVIVFSTGVTVSPQEFSQYTASARDPRVMITQVLPDSPAALAGLKAGDILRYVETTTMNADRARKDFVPTNLRPQQSADEMMAVINNFGGKPIGVEYQRDGHRQVLGITPVKGLVEGKYAIGIAMQSVADVRIPFFPAIWESLKYTGVIIRETVVALYTLVKDAIMGHPDFSQIAGPVGIAGIVGDSARMGFSYLLLVTAIISINLGVINLIPFPALDGGRILVVIIESVSRKKIPSKIANTVNGIGFALLILLMVVITFRDVVKLFK